MLNKSPLPSNRLAQTIEEQDSNRLESDLPPQSGLPSINKRPFDAAQHAIDRYTYIKRADYKASSKEVRLKKSD